MRKFTDLFFITLFSMAFCNGLLAQEGGVQNGAFIHISSNGEVRFLDQDGQVVEPVKVGKMIPQRYTIETGEGGKLVGLLSNGTLLTVSENSRMKVATFEQEPFSDDGRKLNDLPEEPSSRSKVELDLDYGSLVVKTKKLKKSSNLSIHSPLGVAGIRGTEFQMASNAGQGVQLDVTESTVAFTPPGGGQAIPVSQGGGLSVSPSGVATPRPVNPVVAQTIATTNQAATEATQDISLGEVVTAVQQSTNDAESSTQETSESAQSEVENVEEETSESSEPDSEREESFESSESEPEGESEMVEEEPESSEGETNTDEPTETENTTPVEDTQVEEASPVEDASQSSEVEGATAPSEQKAEAQPATVKDENLAQSEPLAEPIPQEGVQETDGVPKSSSEGQPIKEVGVVPSEGSPKSAPQEVGAPSQSMPRMNSDPVKVERPDQSLLMENNPELKKNQRLSKFGLSKDQTDHYDRLSPRAKEAILSERTEVVRRLLNMEGFEAEKSEIFFAHGKELKELLLTMSDEVMINLLDPEMDTVLLKESLQKINQGVVRPENMPDHSPDVEANQRALALADRLKEQENGELMEELLSMSGGTLDEKWLSIGEVAEVLLRNLTVNDFSTIGTFTAEESLNNPFFLELANIYDQLEIDALVNGADKVLGADHLIVSENARAFASHFSDGVEEVVLMSRDVMEFRGDFKLGESHKEGARLVLMSGGEFKTNEGATIASSTSDLVIATRENLLLNQIDLEGAKEVSIRGLRDVHLNEVRIGASELARIKARRDLNVNGLGFKRDPARIVMEATTMRLRNVTFPSASQVRLNSLKGPIDGKYPNFGTTIPAAQQIGRVNFIENVRSGRELLNNRPSFDQHGKNIKIGTINRP